MLNLKIFTLRLCFREPSLPLSDVHLCTLMATNLHTVGSSEKNLEHYSVSVNKTILQYQLPENGGFVIYGM